MFLLVLFKAWLMQRFFDAAPPLSPGISSKLLTPLVRVFLWTLSWFFQMSHGKISGSGKARILFQMRWKLLSHIRFSATPGTVVLQAASSVGFSGEYWSGLPCPSPRGLPSPGIKPSSLELQADSLPFELPRKPLDWYRVLFLQDKLFLRLVMQQCKCT